MLLSIPCVVAFLLIPDLIMRALFMRGKFTAADATAAGQTLAAYALGLLPFVLIRSVTATFLARGDTATPVKASLTAVAVNVVFKVLLMGPLAQVGLALATSIGAWLNLGLVVWFAVRRGHFAFEAGLRRAVARLAVAGRRACRRAMARASAGGAAVCELAIVAGREHARRARGHRRRRLLRNRPRAVRSSMAGDAAGAKTPAGAAVCAARLISRGAAAHPAPATPPGGCHCATPRSRRAARSSRPRVGG